MGRLIFHDIKQVESVAADPCDIGTSWTKTVVRADGVKIDYFWYEPPKMLKLDTCCLDSIVHNAEGAKRLVEMRKHGALVIGGTQIDSSYQAIVGDTIYIYPK